MPKWKVTLYYTTEDTKDVEANTKEDAYREALKLPIDEKHVAGKVQPVGPYNTYYSKYDARRM